MNRCLTLGLLLVCIACVFAQYPQFPGNRNKPPKEKVPEVDQKCLDCICQASSNCDPTIKCHNTAGGGYYCGPFQVSWAYWHDAGKPGDKGHAHDFENCLNNITCAEEAVRGYMRKYGRDCDKSRTIDCYDFSRIHKLGYGACSDESFYHTDYYQKFDVCYGRYEDSYNAGDYNNNGGYNNAGGYNAGGLNNDGNYNNNDGSYSNDGAYNTNNDGVYNANNDGAYNANNDGAYNANNDGAYNANNDGAYNNNNDGSYSNDGSYRNDGGYSNGGGYNNDGSNNKDANVNSGGVGGFVDYGDDHIGARNARMGHS